MKNTNRKLIIGFVVFLIIICSIIFWYFHYTREAFYIFPANGKTENEILGLAGDYFGGILNPFLGFITIMILLWQNNTQKKEIIESKKLSSKKN